MRPDAKLLAFAGAMIRESWEGLDLDGGQLQDLLVKHGLLEEVPATEADCELDWCQEYGIEVGDPIYKATELGQQALEASKP